MRKVLNWYFWLELGTATVTSILFMITLVQRDWVELIFGIDPDNYNGTFEWLIIGALLIVTVTILILARYEWHRARTAVSSSIN